MNITISRKHCDKKKELQSESLIYFCKSMNVYVHPYLQLEDAELQAREYRWRQKVNIYQRQLASLFSCPGRFKGWAEITFLCPPC